MVSARQAHLAGLGSPRSFRAFAELVLVNHFERGLGMKLWQYKKALRDLQKRALDRLFPPRQANKSRDAKAVARAAIAKARGQ